MTSRDGHDATLGRLRRLAPDADRADRLRARCRAQLERKRRRTARAAAFTAFAVQVVAPAVVGGFCLVYVAMLVAVTLRLQGLVH